MWEVITTTVCEVNSNCTIIYILLQSKIQPTNHTKNQVHFFYNNFIYYDTYSTNNNLTHYILTDK
jgi:hypothetical protein